MCSLACYRARVRTYGLCRQGICNTGPPLRRIHDHHYDRCGLQRVIIGEIGVLPNFNRAARPTHDWRST